MAKTTVRETLAMKCQYGRYSWNAATHRITVNKIIKYLRTNPTLDESKPPLMYSDWCTQVPPDQAIVGDYKKNAALAKQLHTVPWKALREHIEQHPELRSIYNGAQPPKTTIRTKTIKEVVERPLALTDDELAEMTLALQRQQHIRNEYVRRAYVARERSTGTGNEAVYQTELDAQIKGMTTLRTLMERLDIPMADWMDKELALAQWAMLEGKEGTDALHVPIGGSDGGGGLAPGPDRAART